MFINQKATEMIVRSGEAICLDNGGKILPANKAQPTVAAPTGGSTQDAECRTAVADLITALKNVGILAS